MNATPSILTVQQQDALYPHRLSMLGKYAPKSLYLQGNITLLELNGIGFCGSRKSSEKGLNIAKDCAEQAAIDGLTVISGNAAGVDLEAHYSALKAQGTTIIVLPEGIHHFRIKNALKTVWDWERVLVISQFAPEDKWQGYRAMARNKIIIGLSHAMIVIEAGEKGGTINAGMETLKYNLPLYVAEYEDMSVNGRGNQKLLTLGGLRLGRSRMTGRANMQKIFAQLS